MHIHTKKHRNTNRHTRHVKTIIGAHTFSPFNDGATAPQQNLQNSVTEKKGIKIENMAFALNECVMDPCAISKINSLSSVISNAVLWTQQQQGNGERG